VALGLAVKGVLEGFCPELQGAGRRKAELIRVTRGNAGVQVGGLRRASPYRLKVGGHAAL